MFVKLNEYIKSLREKNALTQEQAAEKMAVNVATIRNWESGRSIPDMQNIKHISKAYQISISILLQKMAEAIEETIDEPATETIDVCPWTHLLPEQFNYAELEAMRLSLDEAKMLINVKLNSLLGGDLAQLSIADFDSKAEIIEAFNCLIDKGLIKRNYDNEPIPTELGETCLNLIKDNFLYLKNIYLLPFSEFLNVCSKFNLLTFKYYDDNYSYTHPRSYSLIECLKQLYSSETYLDEYKREKSHYSYNSDYEYKHIKNDALINGLDDKYYTLEYIEWDNVDYKADREAYLKKLAFYEENKELIDDLKPPRLVEERMIRKVIPTQLTIDFINELNKA